MKKNAMLKIAAVVLVAVLLTTCAISSTFAKYATTGKFFTDGARVAKWGVEVTTALDKSTSGFAATYGAGDEHVKALNNTDKLVAPGTSGTMTVKFTVSGTSEVSGKVIVRSNEDINNPETTKFLVVDTELNKQLVWTLNGANSNVDAINQYFSDLNQNFDAQEALDIDETVTIGWAWEFEDGSDDLDTALGINGNAPITFSIYADIVQTGPAGAKA